MDAFTVGAAAASSGWSARMLRYVEQLRLVVPRRTEAGYRVYGLRELHQLRSLKQLRERFGLELTELSFAARLHRDSELRSSVERWLAGSDATAADWVDWEQRKHERLLAA